MIYTVTFNPALDYAVGLGKLLPGGVNRAQSEALYWGGKGINVSTVLTRLGVPNKALGFLAGFTGEAILKGLQKEGLDTDFLFLETGFSRINVKIKAKGVTELNGQGPDISPEALGRLYEKLDALLPGDLLVLAGSIPKSLPPDVYERILERLDGRGVRCVVDATGPLLRNVLKYGPFLIKPNHHELGELFERELTSDEEVRSCAKALQTEGARNILVSMGPKGALLLTEDGECHRMAAPDGKVLSAVGSGDSMVAGFLAGYLSSGDYLTALKTGSAAGSATAFSNGLATREEIEAVLKQVL